MRVDGPVADQPLRPRTPPGVGTPLRADGLVSATRQVTRARLERDKRRETVGGSPVLAERAR